MSEADVQALVVLNSRLMQSVLQLERQLETVKQENAELVAQARAATQASANATPASQPDAKTP